MRYWRIISITVISVLVIGTFYMQSVLAEKDYPDFTFTHKSGDEEAVKDLMLRGMYYEGEKNEEITIKTDGADYSSELSFIEVLEGTAYIDQEIKRLQNDYRVFMRGKGIDAATFYEDEEWLIYADVDSGNILKDQNKFTFDIEILEKKANESEEFQMDVPEKEKYVYIYVEDINVMNGELKVITRQVVNRTNEVEFHVYSFDLSSHELSSDEVIFTFEENEENGWSYTELINNGDSSGEPNKNVAIKRVLLEDVEHEDGNIYSEPAGAELIIYNLETQETKNVKLPEEIQSENNTAALVGSAVYFEQQSEKGTELIAFDTESEEIVSQDIIETSFERENEDFGTLTAIKNGKMYVTHIHGDNENPLEITVIDLKTGNTLYEGLIEMNIPNKAQANSELFLHEIVIQ